MFENYSIWWLCWLYDLYEFLYTKSYWSIVFNLLVRVPTGIFSNNLSSAAIVFFSSDFDSSDSLDEN